MKDDGPRYSRVSRKLWTDARFVALGDWPASPQTLWLYLLTSNLQGPVPGLFAAGPGAIADVLGWSPAAVDKHLRALEDAGLLQRHPRPALLWLPKAIRHNQPTSPGQIDHWIAAARELPECALRDRAVATIGKGIRSDKLRERWTALASERIPSGTPDGIPSGTADGTRDTRTRTGTGTGAGTGAGDEATPLGLDAEQAQHPAPEHPLSVYVVEVWSDRKLGKLDTLDAWASRQQDACPGLDLVAEAKRAAAWEDSNPGKRKRDIRRFLGSWFGRQQDRGPGKAGGNRPPWERTLEDVKAEVEANLRAKGIDPDALAY